jgi:raffinose/stachyose/melibiose transport system permease protein
VRVGRWVGFGILCLFSATILVPLAAVLLNSVKTQSEFYLNPWSLPSVPQLTNYVQAWTQAHIPRFMLNSVIVAGASTLLTLATASLAGFAFARFRFRGERILFGAFVLLMIVPAPASIIPLYVIVYDLGLIDTYWSLILPYTAGSLPLAVYLMRSTFVAIPSELIDAARADGCSNLGALIRIVLPLSGPGLATVGILTFVNAWNEFFLALIFIHNDSLMTLPLGLQTFIYQYHVEWPLYFAGLTTAIMPLIVVYLIFQRQFVRGLTAGAVR